ncbi:hypothetical protein PJ985_10080 [Streptomyces sp. ACA25]|uniref:hypothetical protein n=1 Tax=Streptomyces sp. ACA25 TaxID=3022596 RepID=UPI00230742AB|nr:hypothetical protein [Streptomyces sp. ACA25]MDB1087913.1 hypothetical protein [Streptomyces sp. ACA25]
MGVGEGGALADGLRVEGEFDAWVWPGSAMATTPCTVPGTLKDFTLVIDAKYPKDPEESERVLAELIQPYMQAAVARAPCEEHQEP